MNFKLPKLPLMIGAATVLIAGCEHIPDDSSTYFAEGKTTSTKQIMNRQADIGAAKDGTLYAFHFDGDELNSLGRQKLESIERGTPLASDVKLYVDLDVDDDATAARKASVESFLDTLGVPTDRVAMSDGPNPEAHAVGKTLGAGGGGQLGPAGNDSGGIGGATGGGEKPEGGDAPL